MNNRHIHTDEEKQTMNGELDSTYWYNEDGEYEPDWEWYDRQDQQQQTRRTTMKTTYDPTPVEGYYYGIVKSNEAPTRVWTDRGDMPKGNKALCNDWFSIGDTKYNVHPFRFDLAGYPVRWKEPIVDEE